MKTRKFLICIILFIFSSINTYATELGPSEKSKMIQSGILLWKNLNECSNNLNKPDTFLKCTENYILKENNERNYKTISALIAKKMNNANDFRECNQKDLENAPFYNENKFDILICFDFEEAELDQTMISYLVINKNKLMIRDLQY